MYQKSLTTISNILTAAQTTFLRNNYDDITMSGIAQEAGVTKGAIYHHFESKYKVEQYLIENRIPTTIIAPVYFMDNLISPWTMDTISKGTITERLTPTATTKDRQQEEGTCLQS